MVGRMVRERIGARAGYDEILIVGDSNTFYGKGRNGADTHVIGYDPLIDIPHPRVFERQRDGTTVLAEEPFDILNLDWTDQQITFALPFARDGYIPGGSLGSERSVRITHAGVGGTSISSGYWQTGGTGFNTAVSRINAAVAENPSVNNLKAILWVGGANDAAGAVSEATMLAGMIDMIEGFRAQLTGGLNVPVAVSGIVRVMVLQGGSHADIDNALRAVPSNVDRTAYVNTDALDGFPEGNGGFHFCNTAHRLMGPAFYNAISSLIT